MRIKMPAVRIAQADAEVVHQDILTCGVCQKPFALSDIVKFIQHKVLACNKENYALAFNATDPDSDEGVGVVGGGDAASVPLSVANQRRPSISAPMNAKKNTGASRLICTPPLTSPRLPTDMNMDEAPTSTPKRRCASSSPHLDDDCKTRIKQEMDIGSSPDEAIVKRSRIDVVDAESNTTHSEPSNYVCSTCKQRLHSAWRLVQHVQNSHGIKIYVESSPSSSSQGSGSSPCTTSTLSNPKSNANNNHSSSSSSSCSGSSTSSGCSSTGRTTTPQGTPLSLPPPGVASRLQHHPMHHPPPNIDSLHPIINNTPFGVGGLLRMPLGDRPHFPPTSMAAPPISHHGGVVNGPTIFARPSSHDHHFRMEQLVSEQFRLNPHGLGLAAAVAAATGVPPPFGPPALPSGRSVVPSSPTLGLSLEPQLDFYSQRLRQLAGTTSPGAAANSSPSPSPRKQILTPPFTSPNSIHVPATPIMINNNVAHSLNANHSRPESLSSPEKQSPLSDPVHSSAAMTSTTPRSASTPPNNFKPSDLSRRTEPEPLGRDGVHSCEFCGKKFRFQSNLIVHRRTHTGEKPYKCQVCNHACTQSSKLKRHMKIHRRNRGNGGTGGEAAVDSAASTPDNVSHAGSVETLEDDDDDDDDEDDEEDEDEEMELEEEEDDDNFDDDLGGDAPEDLTTKSTSSTPPNNTTNENNKLNAASRPTRTPTPLEKITTSGSLVGELMDKFGLSNIQQYNEAYKQALQESVHIHSKEDRHRSPLITDNNNGGEKMPKGMENGILDKTAAAMRFREEFTKNMIAAGQPPLDLIGVTHGLFGPGTPFENPFDAANKRMKLEFENHHHHHHAALSRGGLPDRDGLYAGLWLPAMAAAHHRDHLFGNDTSSMDLLSTRAKTGDSALVKASSKPSPSSLAAAMNMGISNHPQHHLKKDARRNDTCEFCGKVFKNCSNLTVHRRSHTGEKPYKCELCSYACAQSSKLTRHMKTHGRLGKDVYRCRFCEMPFSVPSTLEKHMRKCVVNQNNKGGHLVPSLISEDTGDSSTSASKDT